MATKTLNVTIKERLIAATLLNERTFNTTTLTTVLKDVPQILMTEEEWAEANLTKTPTDAEIKTLRETDPETADKTKQTWRWDEKNKDIEIDTITAEAILSKIREKSDANELTLEDGEYISLKDKLEAE